MKKIAIVYHSGYGHTQRQAEHVARGARQAGSQVSLIPAAEAESRFAELNAADAIIFGAPTYMGSVSAPFKAFMDSTSKLWQARAWQDKLAAGYTNSASWSGDKLNSLIQMMVFANQHGMIWTSLGLLPGNNVSTGSRRDLNSMGSFAGAMAQSNAEQGADTMAESDLMTAEHLGRRVAEIALRYHQDAQVSHQTNRAIHAH
jgi:NAD(P)H dehydrogenase (quinone)